MAARANAENFEELVLKSELPVLVDFYSDSCIPCKMMAGVVGDIEDDYEGKLNVYKVNVNFDESLASKYEVLAAPTFVAFNKGAETGRIAGKTTAGNKKEYEDGITVAELIVKENVENPEYVTVTVNDDFVERDDFETTKLNEGDAVEFLYFMGGGAY